MEDMSGAAIEYIRGLSIVKSFGQEGASIENFRNASKDLKDIHIKVEKGFTPFNCLHLFALKLASMGIVFICAWQALQGQMSMAFFLMFVLFSFVMFGSVENINDAAHTLGVVDSAMNKLEALENVNYIDQDGTDIKPASYDIEFRDVSFGYDSRIVLHLSLIHICWTSRQQIWMPTRLTLYASRLSRSKKKDGRLLLPNTAYIS